MSSPPKRTWPSLGLESVARTRSKVVFPAPFGPYKRRESPGSIRSRIFFRASRSPKNLETSRSSRPALPCGVSRGIRFQQRRRSFPQDAGEPGFQFQPLLPVPCLRYLSGSKEFVQVRYGIEQGLRFGAELLLLRADSALSLQTRRSEEHTSELQSRPHLVCR